MILPRTSGARVELIGGKQVDTRAPSDRMSTHKGHASASTLRPGRTGPHDTIAWRSVF
jgi:hypothetical protein